MKYSILLASALTGLAALTGTRARADNMASIAITPATGAITLSLRWAIDGNLAGFHQMSQNLGLAGSVANNFYSIKNTAIPAGGDTLAFNFYVAGSGSATPHADIGSKLTPNSYSALTSADPDVGYGSVNLYLIHHKGTTDYFTAIIPGSATSSAVTDEKPMSGPGGPGTVTGVGGYFGLTFAAGNLGYGLNNFYYLRTDPATGSTKFGTLAPALLASSADQFDLGAGGYKALAYTGTNVGYGVDQMYYLRLDPVTGFTILGLLNPSLAGTRHTSDIANLGSVYSTLTFVPGDVGYGPGQFYTTGAVNPTWQSVSFAAIADRAIGAGSFTVNPTASSALPIALTVAAGSTGAATIGSPVGGVFTITPTAPGVITLQATQAGQSAPIAYESNMLRQSFTASGAAIATAPAITSANSASATVGVSFSYAITASGLPTSYGATGLSAGLAINGATGAITGTPTTIGSAGATVTATNATGSGSAILTINVGPAVSVQPASTTTFAGGSATFVAGTSASGATYQWRKAGVDVPGATSATLTIGNVQPANVGYYTAAITSGGGTTTTTPALLEMTFVGKIAGSAAEVGTDISHPNGHIYDQVLLQSASASVKSDAGQMTRLSYVDLTDDIVQVEFSGSGILTINLENSSGPAVATKYNQPGVSYMKGHASIAITGADATTNLSIFSVGPLTAVDQALFRVGTTYDGWADIALVTIATTDGHFGGVRTANANYFRAQGMAGLYAPGVQFSGPVLVGDIDGTSSANAFLVVGSVADARITGGDLFQDNGDGVEVSGIAHLQFTAGTSSQGAVIPAQPNRGQLMTNGVNVTAQVGSP